MDLDDIPAPCWMSDDQGVLLCCNQRLRQWAGLNDSAIARHERLCMSDWLTPAGRIFFETHVWPTLRHDGTITEIFAYWQPRPNQRIDAYVSVQRLAGASPPHYLWLLFAAEERKMFEQALLRARQHAQSQAEQLREAHARLRRLNEQLQQQVQDVHAENRTLIELANQDSLTGLGNRRSLQAVADALIQCMAPRKAFAVLMLDIDHFKQVNDQFGHARGDVVLQEVAQCLRHCARQSDTAVRYGGEEFVLVLPGADLQQASRVARRVHEEIASRRPGGLEVTVSIGVAVAQDANIDLYEVLQDADTAMYQAKVAGRNRTVCHEMLPEE